MDEVGQKAADVAHYFGCKRVQVWRWMTGKALPVGANRRALVKAWPQLAKYFRG